MSEGSNNSSDPCKVDDEFKNKLYSTVFSLVFVMGLLLNAVALYIFACALKHRNETTTYMLNLVVSDMLFVLTLPFRIFYFIQKQWPFGDLLCKISVTLFHTNLYGSIFFLTCINVDRFLAIVYPLSSRLLRTKRNTRIVCCVVWVFLLTASFTAGFQIKTTGSTNTSYCFEKFSNEQWKSELSKVVVVMETVGFVIPLIINIFCSSMILRTLRKPHLLSEGVNKGKILRMIVVHLLTFCFCFTPYNVNLFFYTLVRSEAIKNCTTVMVVKKGYPIAFCIAVTNCCFDPAVYYFTTETIQNSIRHKANMVRKATIAGLEAREESSLYYFRTLRAKFNRSESTL